MKFYQPLLLVFVFALGGSYYLGFTPFLISMVVLLTSILAYWLYAKDKAAAKSGAWHVSENTLHTVSLCCGWPGALLAQYRLRHKTKKVNFRVVFWATVLVNLAGIAWLHSSPGNELLRNSMYQLEDLVIAHIRNESALYAALFLIEMR